MALTPNERAARYRAKNREMLREKYLKWRAENPDKAKLATLRWRENNREKNLADQRERIRRWRELNPERNRDQHREYKQRHPDQIKAHAHVRRARKYGVGYEVFSPSEIHERDGYRCHLCGKKVRREELSLDHLIPLARGGTHSRDNVRTAHTLCNIKRGVDNMPAQLLLVAQ